MAKQLRLDVAQLTDVGRKREHNEDNMAYVIPKDPEVMAKKGALFIVADGMGGHAAGEVASEIAVDTVSNVYYQDDSEDVVAPLLHAIRRANAAIHQRAAENMLRSGMGTTCVAAVLRGNMAYIANVGDSRAYLLRGNQVKQISQDHSWVAEQVRAGLLTEEQARTHAQRNVITRCLGTQAEVEVDVFREQLEEGDSLVLCTDGLSGLVSEEELLRIVGQFIPQESVYHLVERANENGGPDNITAIVVHIQEVGVEPPGVRHPVGVGGREVGEQDTATLGMLPGTAMIHTGNGSDGRMPSGPLHLSSGPLASPDSITAPQPALGRRGRSRLLYPGLFLLLLLVVVLGGGVFYFSRGNASQEISQSLTNAEQKLTQAQGETATNPPLALQDLAAAQKYLRDAQKNQALDGAQATRLIQLQQQLVKEVKAAIGAYNSGARVQVLPCPSATIHPLNTLSTGTQAQSIAAVQDARGEVVIYALGQDEGLYQVTNQTSLLNRIPSSPAASVVAIASGGTNLFVLRKQQNNGVPTGYMLGMYSLDSQGKIGTPITAAIDSTYTRASYIPTLITAWGNTGYVVLANQNSNIHVLEYVPDGKGHLNVVKQYEFSTSVAIASMAVFPDQLFLLLTNGFVQSLPLAGGSLPTNVLVSTPIAQPLSASQAAFTADMQVPTVTPVGQQGSEALNVPSASSTVTATLSAGMVKGVPHLYIGDPANHRVLDLAVPRPAASSATPTMTVSATPTGTPTGKNVTLQVLQQYVSSQEFNVVKSVTVEPKGTAVDVLSEKSTTAQDLVTVGTEAQSACM